MPTVRPRTIAAASGSILLSLLAATVALAVPVSGPPGGVVEGPHGAIPGFPVNSCAVCHDIAYVEVGAISNWQAIKAPDQVCLGCHTDGPTFGTDDPAYQPRPNATPAERHASLVTGSSRFSYGDFGAPWWHADFNREIHCTNCHDPHRTFAGSGSSTGNAKYVRDHTDDWYLDSLGFRRWRSFQDLKVIDQTGTVPVTTTKQVDQAIVYTGVGDLADGIGLGAGETDVCEVCHTLTNHHQADGTAPGGQSHFDGEDCTTCHTHLSGFAPSGGGAPLTGPHAVFGDPDCGSCHDSSFFPGAPDNPDGLASVFCAACHAPDTVARIHSHTATGTARFEYTLECLTCHDQHGWDITNVDGNDNLAYVRATIDEQITVLDKTQVPPVEVVKTITSDIVFDSLDDFADGDALYDRDICVACHTLTNHHQNDGDAPGGQSHRDGEVCTSCHQHPEGFRPPGGLSGPPLAGPHAAIPGFAGGDCLVCHDLYPSVDEMKAHATEVCLSCHSEAWTLVAATPQHVHSSAVTGSARFDYNVECAACHAPHGWQAEVGNVEGGANIRYVRANIDELLTVVDNTVDPPVTLVKEIDHAVVFTALTGDGSFADGDANTTEDVCNTCHTLTNHHQNDGSAPGGQSHFDGQACTSCHLHPEGFGGFSGPHPQAETDCANCHLGPDGEPDLAGLHGNDCLACHPNDFASTILGPIGTWNFDCSECHNPFVAETGAMDEPTKGHRCVACHGEQRATGDLEDIHKKHVDKANCVVCHGFIPDLGVVIGSGNRQICRLCHEGGKSGGIQKIHKKHTDKGASCLECHGGVRPQVDVVDGPPVGSARNVCRICHSNRGPSDFADNPERRHERHTENRLDCGSCHRQANLQDDRVPMPEIDDPVRAQLDRAGYGECAHCHEGGEEADSEEVHDRHLADQWQWCYTCHLPGDGRPTGDAPPVTEPRQACVLCHGSGEQYQDSTPFDVHDLHSDKAKCYSCHQTRPPIGDWPRSWLGGVD